MKVDNSTSLPAALPQTVDVARTWIPRSLAIATFALYALMAPPGFYWLDSAELSAAAAGLGSAHPTGFPLYCLMAKVASMVPVGELAFRLNLLSAACAALTVLWVVRLTRELGRDDLCGIIGAGCAGATLALSLVFARQGTVVEVYAPNAALLSGSLLLFARVAQGGDARWGLALALVCGLGLALHITYVLIGPAVALLLIVRLYRGARWPLCAPLLTVLALGALLLYLPVRSATERTPFVDWGHPDRAGEFFSHITAARYREAYAHEMRSTQPEVVVHQASRLVQGVVDSLGPMAPLFAGLGMLWLFYRRQSRWTAGALAVFLVGDALFSAWVHPWGMDELQNTVPLSLALCVAAGVGLAWFARYLGRAGPYAGAVMAVMHMVPPALVSIPHIWVASSGDLPRAWAQAALDGTPPGGIVLVQNDSTAAGLIYLTASEGARPDVAVLVRQHLADSRRTRAVLELSTPSQPIGDVRDSWLAYVLALERPIMWEIGNDSLPAGSDLVVGVPVSHLVRSAEERAVYMEGASADSDASRGVMRVALARLSSLFIHSSGRDAEAARVHANALTGLGRVAYGRGDIDLAELIFAVATDVRPEHVPAWVNRGVVAARKGDHVAALAHTDHALALEPNHVSALVNVARYAIQVDDDSRARAGLERALHLDDKRADAWALTALLELRAGSVERGVSYLSHALELDPQNPDALDLMRQLNRRSGAGGK